VRDWEQTARDLGERYGVAARIDYLAAGDIVAVARNARGMVTINSTSGTFALAMGIPSSRWATRSMISRTLPRATGWTPSGRTRCRPIPKPSPRSGAC
jgi:hypothetical protein